ncbi:MAG: WYL domain-containing protein [Treponema sp.]|nr:WYL domain-containing protein [Treponema sp.]
MSEDTKKQTREKRQYRTTDSEKGPVAQIKRLYAIHAQISSGKFPNHKKLAQELKVSEMTIHRDLDKLRYDFNAPIEFSYLDKGFYYTHPFEFEFQNTLQNDQLQLLTEAKVFLSHFKNTPVYKGMEDVLDSFCANRRRNNDDDLLLRRIALAPSPEPSVPIKPHIWESLTEALKKNWVISFKYPKPNDDITEPLIPKEKQIFECWTVNPYQILLEKGRAYLFGYVEEKDDVRFFELNKIETLNTLSKHFELPEKFEVENFTGGGNFGAFKRFRPKQYKIAFYEAARPIVRSGNWAADQEIVEDDENERTIITFTSAQDMRILDWVFENKAYALPLEPPSLVARWRYNVAEMARMAGYDVQHDVDIEEVNRMDREE